MVERSALISAIEEDFKQRLPDYHKSRREALTTLAGVMLETRSANLMELAAALPREIGAADHRYQYIDRQLKNEAIDAGVTIKPYALAAIERLAARGQTVVLQMDQSHINDANEVLMLSARLRKRRSRGVARAVDAGEHWLFHSKGTARQRAHVAAERRFHHAGRRPFLWNGAVDWMVSKSRLVLSHSPQGQLDPCSRGRRTDDRRGSPSACRKASWAPSFTAAASPPTSASCTRRATRSPGSS